MTTGVRRHALSKLDLVALVALVGALGMAFLTPEEATQGNVARLFYIHVPTVFVAYLAFATTLVGSVGYLVTKNLRWDHLAVAGAEVGVLFTGLTIALGMIWARPTWGVYWTWSARLTLTAILFFVYLGYLTLRRAMSNPAIRARRSALYGIVSVVQIPIIHFSVLWWRDIHQPPTILRPDELQIDTVLFLAFLAGIAAYALIGAALVRRRYLLAGLEEQIREAVESGAGDIAGDAVTAPRLRPEPTREAVS
jgi:heme exporter protein C